MQKYPRLGFDQFIDISAFNKSQTAGPYVGDVALAEKVSEMLGVAPVQPKFIFVISMENHGPLHLEKIMPGEAEQLCSTAPPEGGGDLLVYLRHLRNADKMAGILRERLETLPRPSWLCWYGDHVPIMPNVYARMGEPDGRTDYLLWQKGGKVASQAPLNLRIESLGTHMLQKIGLSALKS